MGKRNCIRKPQEKAAKDKDSDQHVQLCNMILLFLDLIALMLHTLCV